MATQSNVIPTTNTLSGYLSELNKLKMNKDVSPQLINVLSKMFLLITDNSARVQDRSNQVVMGGIGVNKPNPGVCPRLYYDTSAQGLWADDGGTWHFVSFT